MVAGVVVFLLVPGKLSIEENPVTLTNLVKCFGFALLGGYGGPLVLEKALGSTIAEMKDTITKHQSYVQQQQEQRELDHQALVLVDRQLSDTAQGVVPEDDLVAAIKKASPLAQQHIRNRTSLAWKNMQQNPNAISSGLTERTIPIFRALLETPEGEGNERRLSQLAYALKDQEVPDWKDALHYIDQAIKLVGEGRKMPHHYDYTWALAAMHEPELANALTGEGVDRVKQRLRAALSFEPLRQGFQKELQQNTGAVLRDWLTDRNIDLADLGIQL